MPNEFSADDRRESLFEYLEEALKARVETLYEELCYELGREDGEEPSALQQDKALREFKEDLEAAAKAYRSAEIIMIGVANRWNTL